MPTAPIVKHVYEWTPGGGPLPIVQGMQETIRGTMVFKI